MKFADRVEEFMARYYYSPSQFGRAALKSADPNFVARLRKGRQVTERLMLEVDEWMALGPQKHANIDRVMVALADVPPGPTPKAKRAGPGPNAPVIWTPKLDAALIRLGHLSFAEIGDKMGGIPPDLVRQRAVELGLITVDLGRNQP